MAYDEKVWAMLGSLGADSTHIALRVSLKTEVPIVNSAATDPTFRKPSSVVLNYHSGRPHAVLYAGAAHLYGPGPLTNVALLRVNDRTGRFGVLKFRQAAQRLGHPVAHRTEVSSGCHRFRRSLPSRGFRSAGHRDLGRPGARRRILKQMRELGMKQRSSGSFRTVGEALLSAAGPAAEGMEAGFLTTRRATIRSDELPGALAKRFDRQPEVFASLAFDTMNILLDAVCRAGLNRGKIRVWRAWKATRRDGEMVFDPTPRTWSRCICNVHDGGIPVPALWDGGRLTRAWAKAALDISARR